MEVVLSPEQVDTQECEVLVLGCFEDERPFRGSTGWIDWRLNGMLSRFLLQKRLKGLWKETLLIPPQGRVLAKLILLFGLGKVAEYSYLRLREFAPYLYETLRKLRGSEICLSLPCEGTCDVDCGKAAEVLIEGLADFLDPEESEVNAWGKPLRVFFAEGEGQFGEILMGVQTAKSVLEGRMAVRILVPAEKPTGG